MPEFAIISPDSTKEMQASCRKLGLEPIMIDPTPLVALPITGHPDIQVFAHRNHVFCHPNISMKFLKKIERHVEITICKTPLTPLHPGDISYNIASIGNVAFHKKNYTEPQILEYIHSNSIELIPVKQGYSGCSVCRISDESLITSDASIFRQALARGLECLLIDPKDISLPGYSHGLIGGASGIIGDFILFTGTINHLRDWKKIMAFIEGLGKRIHFLSRDKIIDLGSIIII